MQTRSNWIKYIRALALGLVTFLASSTGFAFAPETADQTALQKLVSEGYAGHINAEDSESFAALFTEDAVRVPPGRKPEVTRPIIQAGIKKVLGIFDFDVTVEVISMEVDGDFAMIHGIGSGLRSKTSEGKEKKFAARGVWICKRMDGEWQIWRQVWHPIKKAK